MSLFIEQADKLKHGTHCYSCLNWKYVVYYFTATDPPHSACDPRTEFRCSDGACIDISGYCDRTKYDCEDGSDETQCGGWRFQRFYPHSRIPMHDQWIVLPFEHVSLLNAPGGHLPLPGRARNGPERTGTPFRFVKSIGIIVPFC